MNSTIVPERLAQLDQITLDEGSHGSFERGHCAMEVVAWLADQGRPDVGVAVAAAADAAADAQSWGTSYSAAYAAARDYYKKNPLPIMGAIADLAAKQQSMALELLDAMIEAKS